MRSKKFSIKQIISVVLSVIVMFSSFSIAANAKAKKYVKSI